MSQSLLALSWCKLHVILLQLWISSGGTGVRSRTVPENLWSCRTYAVLLILPSQLRSSEFSQLASTPLQSSFTCPCLIHRLSFASPNICSHFFYLFFCLFPLSLHEEQFHSLGTQAPNSSLCPSTFILFLLPTLLHH